jgi:hypothetical protein
MTAGFYFKNKVLGRRAFSEETIEKTNDVENCLRCVTHLHQHASKTPIPYAVILGKQKDASFIEITFYFEWKAEG